MGESPSATVGAAWRLRWRVLRRERLGALEGLLLAGLSGLAALTARAVAARGIGDAPLAAGLSAILAALLVGLAWRGDALLHRASELSLLLPAGLSPRALVRLRLLELTVSAAAGLTPLCAALAALRAAQGATPSPWLLAAGVTLAPTLAALALLVARAGRAAPPALLLLLAGAGAVGALRPEAVGAALLAACDGAPAGALPILLAPAPALLLLELLGPRGQARALDRAARRPARARGLGQGRLQRWLRPLLGPAAAGLLARDLLLLARGGFPRGAVVLLLLPLGLLAMRAAASDPTLEPWQLLLAGLLVSGMLAAGTGYLFAVDFPRARGPTRELERVLPVTGEAAFRARMVPALLLALLLLLGVAALLPAGPRSPGAGALLLRGALLALAVTHDAASQGLAAESSGDPTAGAAAYPLRSATLVVLLAGALSLHPLGILLWPLLGWPQAARAACRAWERGEVPVERRPGA